MLPVSLAVSVVLAAILSIIHFSFRIVLNSDNFPELFIQTVSNNENKMNNGSMHLCVCVNSINCSGTISVVADSGSAISGNGKCVWFVLSYYVGCCSQ